MPSRKRLCRLLLLLLLLPVDLELISQDAVSILTRYILTRGYKTDPALPTHGQWAANGD